MRVRRAFTLIELLVVIAIVALLAALLMPALTRAKASGRRVACASNLRQLTIALDLYAVDHEGLYPPRAQTSAWPGRLFSGYENLDVLICPTERRPSAAGTPLEPDGAPRSYVMNSFSDHFSALLTPSESLSFTKGSYSGSLNEAQVRIPTETIVFAEKKTGSQAFYLDVDLTATDSTSTSTATMSSTSLSVTEQRRHMRSHSPKSGGSNHAFADGSVRYIPYGRSLYPQNQWAITGAGRTNYAIRIY